MAVRPGEENVATLFGDIHYFYGPPEDNPPHHRFDKDSYVYLFENAIERRARIEVANRPGTDDQDAFDGYLDNTRLQYSYKRTCLVTLTVGEIEGNEEWHLPTYDPHNQNKYHYRLHSLDIYFWTQQDALQFVNGIRRVLPPAQCEVLDEPGPPPRHSATDIVSPVVQKLERAAIADDHRNSADVNAAAMLPHSDVGIGASLSFAAPPLSAVSSTTSTSTANSPPQAYGFVPMAYNPAAPGAPEQIRHREKTPPPEDGGVNPLHQTLAYDATTPFSPGLPPNSGIGPLVSPGLVAPPQFQPPPGAPIFPAPPMHSVTSPGMPPQGFGSIGGALPPQQQQQQQQQQYQHPGLARAATIPIGPGSQSPGLVGSPYGAPAAPSFGPASPPTGFLPHHTATPPVTSPGIPPPAYAGPPVTATPPPHHVGMGMGMGMGMGYGGGAPPPTTTTTTARTNPATAEEYAIHQQFYVPEGGEAASHYKPKKEVRGKLEENAGRLERGVNGFLKKFESRFG